MANPPLNSLRAFEAVARLGSFRAAAEALFVTQSAVSHQIRNIEEWLGKPLFEREGNRTRLLPHGADLARSLTAAFDEIDRACSRARGRKISQSLVIAAIPSVAVCWLIPRLNQFRAAHPEIVFHIIYAIHGHDINFDDVDLAFVFSQGKPVRPNVESELFLRGHSIPVCSPTLLDRLGRHPETTADFQQLSLLHDGDTSGWSTWLEGVSDATPTAGNTALLEGPSFEDFNLLRAAALSGQGVALCPLAMIKPDLDSGSLVQISERALAEGHDYYIQSSVVTDPLVTGWARTFRDWAMAECQTSAP